MDTLGWVYFKLGNHQKAEEWIKKAILLHFKLSEMRSMEAGALHFFDSPLDLDQDDDDQLPA